MKDLIIKQMQFEFWANTELLNTMTKAASLNPRAIVLFSHLLSAGSMWLSRLKYDPITTTLFQERTVEESGIMLKNLKAGWTNYLETVTLEDLNRIIEFTSPVDNSKRSIKASDAIMHVVHHSSYHRGQIITLLKGSIEQVPLITYMPFASREIA